MVLFVVLFEWGHLVLFNSGAKLRICSGLETDIFSLQCCGRLRPPPWPLFTLKNISSYIPKSHFRKTSGVIRNMIWVGENKLFRKQIVCQLILLLLNKYILVNIYIIYVIKVIINCVRFFLKMVSKKRFSSSTVLLHHLSS